MEMTNTMHNLRQKLVHLMTRMATYSASQKNKLRMTRKPGNNFKQNERLAQQMTMTTTLCLQKTTASVVVRTTIEMDMKERKEAHSVLKQTQTLFRAAKVKMKEPTLVAVMRPSQRFVTGIHLTLQLMMATNSRPTGAKKRQEKQVNNKERTHVTTLLPNSIPKARQKMSKALKRLLRTLGSLRGSRRTEHTGRRRKKRRRSGKQSKRTEIRSQASSNPPRLAMAQLLRVVVDDAKGNRMYKDLQRKDLHFRVSVGSKAQNPRPPRRRTLLLKLGGKSQLIRHLQTQRLRILNRDRLAPAWEEVRIIMMLTRQKWNLRRMSRVERVFKREVVEEIEEGNLVASIKLDEDRPETSLIESCRR
ncbi:hypothetical protein BKA64DRAFT_358150 [Cadophora sp. MPI-SDFR-AT-0126]|nr:hypothetical protein BKA64DRAFT_358150 [Leotiomycetes sp. MPI-SDFR-AT-0126]